MKRWSYEGRWGLITGASAGLGAEFARQLATRRMSLVLSARRVERLEQLASELRERHDVEVIVVPADLSREREAIRLWTAASAERSIDLLVNNAGFGAQGRFDEVPVERLADMVRLNCIAVLELAHAAVREMRNRGDGGIINVASLAAFQPVPRLATYAATKAFVLSLSQALWAENRDAGVRVVALCPGRTPTEFQGVAGTGDPRGSFGVLEPEAVVRSALAALERGKISVVPGLENRLASVAGRLVPRTLLTGVLGPIIERRSQRGRKEW
ncbi:MAG TPA: SDR family oxidoreductase [Longimicrobiaceae bacterium]